MSGPVKDVPVWEVVTTLCKKKRNVCRVGSPSQWAGLENADFWATDLGSAVSNVVLRIVGQSVACASLGH